MAVPLLTAAPAIVGGVVELARDLIGRFFPDKTEAAKAEAEFARMLAAGELQGTLEQLRINAIEAAHPSLFVSGGRPLFFWIGGVAFGYSAVLQPMLTWLATIKGWPAPPDINVDLLWSVIAGLLGFGGFRSVEKIKGVASK